MNVNLFKANMVKRGETGKDIANLLGMAESTFSLKLNERKNSKGNVSEFTKSDIEKLKNHWKLTNEEIIDIFF